MRDLKHLSRRKEFSLSTAFGRNRKKPANAFKSLNESGKKKARLRLLLPLLAVVLAAYPVMYLFTSPERPSSGPEHAVLEKPRKSYGGKLDAGQSFQLAIASLENARADGDRLVLPLRDGSSLLYTINMQLQNRVKKVMEDNQVPYGVFVAIEPKTGRILALAGHSEVNPEWARDSFFKIYPMASLFKIVTAAAALEQKKVGPATVFAFRGSSVSENPRAWSVKPGGASQQISLTLAMGKSINPVFGRLASDVVGRELIMRYAGNFGFNQTIFPGIPVMPSRAEIPQSVEELRLMGAGLGREVKISPLHAASMMAAIANSGTMMVPELAQEIRNESGRLIYSRSPQSARTLLTSEAAKQLAEMLSTTVSSGTSRRAFHDRRGRPKLASIDIRAKTGSINGKEPEGWYTWFAAYAPAEDPQIALVALVINQDRWKIKASYLGEQALEAFFNM